jgi:uncharacterized membrane protein HdeD (DUF308 family)
MMYNYLLLIAFLGVFMIVFGLADLACWIHMKRKQSKSETPHRLYQGKL